MVDMEYRKLIKFGKNSYVVSLPKKWVDSNNMKKGNAVYIDTIGNSLFLSPEQIDTKKEVEEVKINAKNEKLETMRRKIISAYINNVDILNIKLAKNIPADEIRSIIHNLMALEIIEHTSTHIIAKGYLNMNDISITNLLRKVDTIIRSMFTDFLEVISKQNFFSNIEVCDTINERDKDINRLTFLIKRTIKYSMTQRTAGYMDASNLLMYWRLSDDLEDIGDEIKRVVRFMVGIDLRKFAYLVELMHNINRQYLESMKVFYRQQKEEAYLVAAKKNKILSSTNDFLESHKDNIILQGLAENLRTLIRGVHDLTRLTYE
ncbi:phosphate uptake regulator PhoU [Candidatus Woesearchaeota archaeon]|nr:phosphate uptake regulator PhoU [Candidatus Woesearchaeota archaeon]